MLALSIRRIALVPMLLLSVGASLARSDEPSRRVIRFDRDVRPVLSNACFRCHGPDEARRKGKLRLDRRDAAMAGGAGGAVIVPGDPESSELLARILSEDDNERMPPPNAAHPLDAQQIATIREWIVQGASWTEHWSLVPPVKAAIPEVRDASWVRNPIDSFLLARMDEAGVAPAPEADRVTLARRVHLDLVGLPPTPEEVDAFVSDTSPDAYERLVDRLIASPHYGERMALPWLDLVRFADTVGYHSDVPRAITPYRDYVITSFNENTPFDQFTVEQLAGDLLPNSTTRQKVASSYNMLGMTTEEGGAQPKEYLARYAADRVRNAGSVWLGATLACAECHDHKYDPYTARDFYSFAAFFADIKQEGVGTPRPSLMLPTAEQERTLESIKTQIARLDRLRLVVGMLAGVPPAGSALLAARDLMAIGRGVAQVAIATVNRSVRKTITTVTTQPRTTRILRRGDWQDDGGDVVQPAVPGFFKPLDLPEGRRANRLDLARWLVDRDHPLTARVAVNRVWKLFFGTGLAATLEDLGSQGEWPTHPELLDWLSVDFVENGWDVKRLVRMIVTSSAYRQASMASDETIARDPANRLYARQNSVRLEAEFVRDNALAASGLISLEVGGESVRPYQPDGYWRYLNFPPRKYVESTGPEQYRRGLYVHRQRTLPHPALLAFDAPSREECTARRPISNTPQAALVLLNDPTFVEAARALATRTITDNADGDRDRMVGLWRRVLARQPSPRELELLGDLLTQHRREFRDDRDAAKRLISVGQMPADPNLDEAELAAWTSVARAVLNLDETITRE